MSPFFRRSRIVSGLAALVFFAAGCSAPGVATDAVSDAVSGTAGIASTAAATLDATTVHSIALTVDDEARKAMIQTYLGSGEKEWISGSVTIDGQRFENVGIKLKGNSTLRGITVDTPAQDLPLRIRLDKYVDGQQWSGLSDFAVRANSSETSMNEAVALDLLADAGLASTQAIATRFSVNGGDATLRLTVQNLDDAWVRENFPDAGADSVLYKAESEGNWSWRGADGDYSTAFDIEAGADNYQPLVELLDLLNNGTDEELAAKLPTLVDLDSFATYLAFQEIIDNVDDIDGPGNNSYLFWDSATGKFTVVAWDHNLAFGASMGGGGFGGAGGPRGAGGQGGGRPAGMPEGMTAPEGGFPGGGQAGGGMMARSNPLVTAFKANAEWTALYDTALSDLKASLLTGGALTRSVDAWSATLTAGASDLVPADTVTSEADAIRKFAG
ncbi:MAG: CotH kinase family protein [Nigerium sp.]|nr:CotH kinase family protein [Nigerium sp.]